MRPLYGNCLVSFEPDEDRIRRADFKFDIIIPDSAKRKARTAFVHIHHASWLFGEDLTGKKVIVDRWSGQRFTHIHTDGKEYEFYVVSERAVLAVFEGEER